MKKLFLLILCCLILPAVYSQQPPRKNPTVEKIVKEISAKHIKATVEKLVTFGTRHT
ncbi:MAG: peptidase M28, partial [Ignavibacteriales bacterium]|nr:peptidase M28 [Ignavibacteriales bacterium]